MASPVKDAKLKAQQIWPNATIHSRGKGHIIYQHPTNPRRKMEQMVLGGRGFHFGDGPFDETHEVDTAWIDAPPEDAPWQKKMVLADYHTYFGPGYTNFRSDPLIKYVHPASGESVTFQPMGLYFTNDLDDEQQISEPTEGEVSIVDDLLTWANAYGPDIDFRWRNQSSTFAKFITVNNLSALGSPLPYIIAGGNPALRVEFIFEKSVGLEVWVNGVLWDEKSNNPQVTLGDVEFRLSGESLWYFRSPRVENGDAEMATADIEMRLKKSGNDLFVEIRVPWSWLETAIYPVIIDPTIEPATAASADDGGEFSTGNTEYTGTADRIGGNYDYTFLRFQCTGPASGDIVDVAYLSLYFGHANRDDPYCDIDAEDIDTSPTITSGSGNYNISGRTLTGNPVSWIESNLPSTWNNTFSLVTPAQAVLNRGGWSSGNYMGWQLADPAGNGDYVYRAYDYGSNAPIFHLEYTEAGGNVDIEVPVAALTLTGYVPTIQTPVNITIPVAALALTGYPPTVEITEHVDVEIPVAALTLTGYPPTVEITEHVNVEIPVAALTLTGYPPTVEATAHVDIEVPVAALALTGYVPSVGIGVNITVPVAALTLTGYAPTVEITQHVNIEVPVAALTLTGYAPEIEVPLNITIPTAALTLTGYPPTVEVGADIDIEIPTAALTLTGYVPDIEAIAGLNIVIPTGALVLTGYAPIVTITEHIDITIPAGALTLTGYIPTVEAEANIDIEIPLAALTLIGYPPSVSFGIITKICIGDLEQRSTALVMTQRNIVFTLDERDIAITPLDIDCN